MAPAGFAAAGNRVSTAQPRSGATAARATDHRTSTFVAGDNGDVFRYDPRSLTARRRSTVPRVRYTSADSESATKSIELDTRVAGVEVALARLEESINLLNKRVLALQAHLDHVSARLGRG